MSDDYGNLFAFHSTTEKECEHCENNLHNIAKVIFYNTSEEKKFLTSFCSTKNIPLVLTLHPYGDDIALCVYYIKEFSFVVSTSFYR